MHKKTYWMCPKGCSDKKIEFREKCQGCDEKFMYYVLDERMRTKEDLFESDEEPELWNCKKCNNQNIDVKKNCSKCKKNKY
jgi:hypothetical protein